MSDEIRLVKRTLIHEGASLRTYTDLMEFDGDKTELWDYIEHRFNAAAIIPVLPNGNVILVSQYRPATGRKTWEIPAGKRDDDGKESPYLCAKRELSEETGYASDNIEHAFTLRPAVAYCSETIHVYIAHDIYKCGEQQLDECEFINIREFTLLELLDMIRKEEIQDGKTISSIFYLNQK